MEKQPLLPTLRFPEFKDEWINKKYNKIYSFYSTNSFSREKLNYEKGEVKNIHYGDIHTKFRTLFNIEEENVPFINSDIDLSKIKDENFCQEGDILIADASEDYNDIGKTTEIINLNNQKLISGLHTFHARPNKHKMALGFSGYLLQSWKVRKQVMTIAQGTKVLGLATSRLGNINLIIPTLPEQQKIASFLNEVDTHIHTLEKKKSLLESYKKGVKQKIFSQELRFKDDNGNNFPKWKTKKITDLAKTSIGLVTTMTKYYVHQNIGIPLIRNSDIMENKIRTEKLIYLDKDFSQTHNNRKLKYNDVVTVHTGEIGVSSVISKELDGCHGFATLNTRINDLNQVLPSYLSWYFNSEKGIKYALSMATGDGRSNYNLKDFNKATILIPHIKEQTKIANFLNTIDTKIEALQNQITNTKEFKKGLLQKMFV